MSVLCELNQNIIVVIADHASSKEKQRKREIVLGVKRTRMLKNVKKAADAHENGKWTSLTSGHSERFTTLPHIHPFIHTLTPTVESTTQGDSQLVRSSQGEASHTSTEEQGIEPATFRLTADPLYLLSHMQPFF